MAKKIKTAEAVIQFTYKGVLYRKGDSFGGTRQQTEILINKNYLKWQ